MYLVILGCSGNELFNLDVGPKYGVTFVEHLTSLVNERIKNSDVGRFEITEEQFQKMWQKKEQDGGIVILTLPKLCLHSGCIG